MTTTLSLAHSVSQWVIKHPATSRVFEQYKINYCCGGGQPLEEACGSRNVDAQAVLMDLLDAISCRAADDTANDEFESMSLADMCDSITSTHHEYLKRELPRLTLLVDRVVSVHGNHYGWLHRLGASFQKLRDELLPHMSKEEQILFPAIRMVEQSQAVPRFPFGSVDNPIRMMEHEHDAADQALKSIRAVSSDFTLPEGGCNTFRAMLDGLQELESDLHRHIHKENNVLFPRASQLAAKLSGASKEEAISR